jgi:hypothetical protein
MCASLYLSSHPTGDSRPKSASARFGAEAFSIIYKDFHPALPFTKVSQNPFKVEATGEPLSEPRSLYLASHFRKAPETVRSISEDITRPITA